MVAVISVPTFAAAAQQADVVRSLEALGGHVTRAADGAVVEVSLARTWASDHDVERLAEIKTIKRLDLSFTYVTDAGVQHLQELPELEDLTLDTVEALTDAAASYLRADKKLRRLVLRGTDITDVGMPYLASLTGLKSLDLSHTMIGDVGLESLPALSELEELNLGGTHITGTNLNFLKVLPKLRKLSFSGIQRRNAGACWTPLLTDLDMETISLLSPTRPERGRRRQSRKKRRAARRGELPGRRRNPVDRPGCREARQTGALAAARHQRCKNYSCKPEGSGESARTRAIEPLELRRDRRFPAPQPAALSRLTFLDLSATGIGDLGLQQISALPGLKFLYLTDTRTTPQGLEAFGKKRQTTFVSWTRRPEPAPADTPGPKKKTSVKAEEEPQP